MGTMIFNTDPVYVTHALRSVGIQVLEDQSTAIERDALASGSPRE